MLVASWFACDRVVWGSTLCVWSAVTSVTVPRTTFCAPVPPYTHTHVLKVLPNTNEICMNRLTSTVFLQFWHYSCVHYTLTLTSFWHGRDSTTLPQQHKFITAQQRTTEKSLCSSTLRRNFLSSGLGFWLEKLMEYPLLTHTGNYLLLVPLAHSCHKLCNTRRSLQCAPYLPWTSCWDATRWEMRIKPNAA